MLTKAADPAKIPMRARLAMLLIMLETTETKLRRKRTRNPPLKNSDRSGHFLHGLLLFSSNEIGAQKSRKIRLGRRLQGLLKTVIF
jgi:hypothetical protein